MRPKLKSDTFFIPVDEGVYVRNNEKSFTIKGKTLATWLERLAPALDGQHDLQDLCEALPREKRQVIEHLVLKLAEQGCIKDTDHELSHTLSPALLEIYGPAITFIDYHTDSGAARFQRFLETPVHACLPWLMLCLRRVTAKFRCLIRVSLPPITRVCKIFCKCYAQSETMSCACIYLMLRYGTMKNSLRGFALQLEWFSILAAETGLYLWTG